MTRQRLERIAAVTASVLLLALVAVQSAVANLPDCSNCIEAGDIASGAVNAAELDDDLDDTITQNDIASGGVGAAEIASSAVRASELSSAVETRLIADKDETANGSSVDTDDEVTLNAVNFTAPVAGHVVISGITYIRNLATEAEFRLQPQVDGVGVLPAAHLELQADGTHGDEGSQSYTVTEPISAGAHTISQVIGPGNSDWYYNGNELTVLFVPGGYGTTS